MSLFNNSINNGLLADDINMHRDKTGYMNRIANQPTEQERLTAAYAPLNARGVMDQSIANTNPPQLTAQQTINKNAPKVSQTPTVITNPTQDQQNWMEIEAAGGYEAVKNDPKYNYEARQNALQKTLEDKELKSSTFQNVIQPSHPYGKQVTQAFLAVGSRNALDDLGDQIVNTFADLGFTVTKDKLFRTPIYFSSPEGHGISDGTGAEGIDYNYMNYLNDDLKNNRPRLYEHLKGRDELWKIGTESWNKGQLLSHGGHMTDFPLVDNTYSSYMGIGRSGWEESRPTDAIPAIPPENIFSGAPQNIMTTTPGTPAVPAQLAIRNTVGHEYAHYLDGWMSNGNESLTKIAESLRPNDMPFSHPSAKTPNANDFYQVWMNDPRTAHLDVVDNINTVMQGAKVNNPREILGKLFATSMVNPIPHPNGGNFSLSESFARAMSTYFNPNTSETYPHIQGIKDMRSDVIGAIANLLNQ